MTNNSRSVHVLRRESANSPMNTQGENRRTAAAATVTAAVVDTICHKFLGAKIFDGQSKPLAGCKYAGTNCRFEHTIPNEPVQAHVLKDLMRAANIIYINAPEKKKALLAILNAPGFSV